MLGLINCLIQCFLRDSFGPLIWHQVAFQARLGFDDFEPMLSYDDEMTERLVSRPPPQFCSAPAKLFWRIWAPIWCRTRMSRRCAGCCGLAGWDLSIFFTRLRTCLRGGVWRCRLELPLLEVCDLGQDDYLLRCAPMVQGVGHVMVGLLRAMADDYGALVLLEHGGDMTGDEVCVGADFGSASHCGVPI